MSCSVIVHRTSLMQAVGDRVRTGYRLYCTGTVTADRAASWVRKASRYYAVDLDRSRRARAKQRGEGCAYLLLHEDVPGLLVWVLLVTAGDHPAHQLERLRDVLDPAQRLELFGYELVRLTKPGTCRPVWTWRMSALIYQALRTRVIDTVRRGDTRAVRQLVVSLYRSAGFYGVRSQVGRAVALLKAEWRRRRGSEPLPHLPRILPYVRRLPIESVSLPVWLSAYAGATQSSKQIPPRPADIATASPPI